MRTRYNRSIPNSSLAAQVPCSWHRLHYKWVEAEPLVTIIERNIRNFEWKNIVCRFGIPRVLVSDNGKQFDNKAFRDFCQQLSIKNHYSSLARPQANGQVEVANRSLLKLIKTWLEQAKGIWPDELLSVLWVYHTTTRTSTRETPFKLAFGTKTMIPSEVRLTSLRLDHYNNERNDKELCINLDLRTKSK